MPDLELLEALKAANDLCADLRLYTHAWDAQYGVWWDKEKASIEQTIRRAEAHVRPEPAASRED